MRTGKIAALALVTILAVSLVVAAGCGEKKTAKGTELILATTTSTQDSGLLDELVPEFGKKYGVTVKTVAAGTGEALAMGERGDADVLLVHSKASEEEFVDGGFGLERVEVMYNDFVIVGPQKDPAGVKGGKSAVEAFSKIAATGSTFASRGDDSGTHKKEKKIWEEAGIDPAGNAWYMETGQGMGDTLTVASEKQAYTLSDRATYMSKRESLDLLILVEGDEILDNQYSVIVVDPDKHPGLELNVEGAADFVEFLTGSEGQDMIGEYTRYDTILFHPNAKEETRGMGDQGR